MIQNVFCRYEKKYLLNEWQYESIKKALEPYMEIDRYGQYNIRNIYYDTSDYELIRTSLEKPQYKEKFRVRCYGQPDEEARFFLEIKKKYKGLVNKRRITLGRKEMEAYLERGERPGEDSQIFREIDYFFSRYSLEPKLYLAYDRIAYSGKEDEEFRVTFDRNIRSRARRLCLENDEDTQELLPSGYYLMEVKILRAMPLWFAAILSELEIKNISFSKYGSVYRTTLFGDWYRDMQSKPSDTVWQENAGHGNLWGEAAATM